jgi:hypothetical protein
VHRAVEIDAVGERGDFPEVARGGGVGGEAAGEEERGGEAKDLGFGFQDVFVGGAKAFIGMAS